MEQHRDDSRRLSFQVDASPGQYFRRASEYVAAASHNPKPREAPFPFVVFVHAYAAYDKTVE
jgi:hypothetical protein